MSSGDYGAGGAGKESTVTTLYSSYYFLTCSNSKLLKAYSNFLVLEHHSNPKLSTRYKDTHDYIVVRLKKLFDFLSYSAHYSTNYKTKMSDFFTTLWPETSWSS